MFAGTKRAIAAVRKRRSSAQARAVLSAMPPYNFTTHGTTSVRISPVRILSGGGCGGAPVTEIYRVLGVFPIVDKRSITDPG